MARRLPLALAVLTWTAAAVCGGPVLYLRPAAVLAAGDFTLGAIADVRSDDPREAAELAASSLGPAPGRAAYLPPLEVRRRVKNTWAGQVDLVGAGVALLPQDSVPPRQQAAAAALLAALSGAGRAGAGWLEVDFLSPLPENTGEVRFPGDLSRGARPSGRMQIGLGEASVLVFVHPIAPVARASRDLPRAHPLTAGDVDFVEEDLSKLGGGYLTAADLQGSFRLLVPVSRGALLEPSRLARNLLVKAGERVTVVLVRPGLTLTLAGKAWGSAGEGEAVEVSLRDPARRFRGRVLANGEVLVEQL